jgi:rhodanese-related sulfurtransferase
MKRTWLSRLTLNQKLALTALALGVVAIGANPYGGGRVVIESGDLASLVAHGTDRIAPLDLADWLIKGQRPVRVIDLRTAAEYAEYHIPGAEHVPVTGLERYPLLRNEPIVLYSSDGLDAAQAWFLLKARGYRQVSILDGGMQAWVDRVLFPALAENPAPEQRADDARRRAVSAFFGGKPRSGAEAAATAEVSLPKIDVPAAVAPVRPAKKKRKEGC